MPRRLTTLSLVPLALAAALAVAGCSGARDVGDAPRAPADASGGDARYRLSRVVLVLDLTSVPRESVDDLEEELERQFTTRGVAVRSLRLQTLVRGDDRVEAAARTFGASHVVLLEAGGAASVRVPESGRRDGALGVNQGVNDVAASLEVFDAEGEPLRQRLVRLRYRPADEGARAVARALRDLGFDLVAPAPDAPTAPAGSGR